jgi:hypothetical protein
MCCGLYWLLLLALEAGDLSGFSLQHAVAAQQQKAFQVVKPGAARNQLVPHAAALHRQQMVHGGAGHVCFLAVAAMTGYHLRQAMKARLAAPYVM